MCSLCNSLVYVVVVDFLFVCFFFWGGGGCLFLIFVLTVVVFVVAPYFFRPGKSKKGIVTAVILRKCRRKVVWLWFLQHSTDHRAE